jgi:hypothetical protein
MGNYATLTADSGWADNHNIEPDIRAELNFVAKRVREADPGLYCPRHPGNVGLKRIADFAADV